MMKRFAVLVLFAACTGSPSGATCPTDNAPTYDAFAKPFMASYCTGCHSRATTNRHGAPAGVDFDSEEDLRQQATAIDEVAAKGPSATNASMPDMSGPVHAAPTDAEREQLGQFLACEQMK